MKIKFEKGKITASVTKAYYNKAHTFGTPEFREWRAACNELGVEIELVVKSRNIKNQNEDKNMSYKNMVIYMNTCENKKELLEEFETIKKRSLIQENPRAYVREWFKAKVPNYKAVLEKIAEENKEEAENNVVDMTEKVSA